MIVIYFVLFNLKRNRVKHWFRNTAEASYEICIFKSLTCYWWWFNSTMNCISSLHAGLFWLRTWWVPDSAVFTLARLITLNSALFWQCILRSCPVEFCPRKLTGPVETELRCSSSFLWAVRSLSIPAAKSAGCFGRSSLRRPLVSSLPVNVSSVFTSKHLAKYN